MADWIRFYEIDQACPLCQHDDACSISADGKTICCCRVKSDRLIGKPFAGGYLHPSDKKYDYKSLRAKLKKKKLPKNWRVLQNFYSKNILVNSTVLNELTAAWNVPSSLLLSLGLGWDGSAYTTPMYKDLLTIIGIQRRFKDNSKRMVEGSKLGIFIGWQIDKQPEELKGPMIICEGFSDTVTAANYGYYAMGRPSWGTGIDEAVNVLELLDKAEVVIIADSNEVGQWGAELMLKTLQENKIKSRIILPPKDVKDLRQWRQKGLTKEQFDNLIAPVV